MKHTSIQNVGKAAVFAFLTAFLMSIVAAMIKYLAATVSIEMILLVQYLTCLLLVFPLAIRNNLSALKTEYLRLHLIRGVAGWICMYTYLLAIKYIPLVDAVLLRNSAPIFVTLLAPLYFKVHISKLCWVPITIGLIGIGLVLQPDYGDLKLWHFLGIFSAVAMAWSIITTKRLTTTEPPSRILFYYFLISFLLSVPLGLGKGAPVPPSALPLMFVVGIFTVLSIWCYTRAYYFASATIISPISYTGVVFSGLWGWLIWSQLPNNTAIVGSFLIIVGSVGSVVLGKAGHLKSEN